MSVIDSELWAMDVSIGSEKEWLMASSSSASKSIGSELSSRVGSTGDADGIFDGDGVTSCAISADSTSVSLTTIAGGSVGDFAGVGEGESSPSSLSPYSPSSPSLPSSLPSSPSWRTFSSPISVSPSGTPCSILALLPSSAPAVEPLSTALTPLAVASPSIPDIKATFFFLPRPGPLAFLFGGGGLLRLAAGIA